MTFLWKISTNIFAMISLFKGNKDFREKHYKKEIENDTKNYNCDEFCVNETMLI